MKISIQPILLASIAFTAVSQALPLEGDETGLFSRELDFDVLDARTVEDADHSVYARDDAYDTFEARGLEVPDLYTREYDFDTLDIRANEGMEHSMYAREYDFSSPSARAIEEAEQTAYARDYEGLAERDGTVSEVLVERSKIGNFFKKAFRGIKKLVGF